MSSSPSTPDSHPLSTSMSSLSSSMQQSQPNVTRSYKQASQMFLTRRVPEALEMLEPIIEPQPTENGVGHENGHDDQLHTNGASEYTDGANGVDGTNGVNGHSESTKAPIAEAPRAARVKVWSLYISILNAVVEMGAEEGKQMFGAAKWKELVRRAKEGTVWDQVVANGYNGFEGSVDADVVANLATLLLAHAPSQKHTQNRIETYLSASSSLPVDITSHMQRSKSPSQLNGNGTSTPRDLNSRLKILEIYSLYVLPRNGEWDYAREFINMSEILDEERRDALLQALQGLKDEQAHDAKREEELQKQREQQLEDARRKEAEIAEKRAAEEAQKAAARVQSAKPAWTGLPKQNDASSTSTSASSSKAVESSAAATAAAASPSARPKAEVKKSALSKATGVSVPSRNPGATSRAPASRTLYRRAYLTLSALQDSVLSLSRSMSKHPMMLFRLVLFAFALIMAFARQEVRDRVVNATDRAWGKIKQTVGMGVKVSYI